MAVNDVFTPGNFQISLKFNHYECMHPILFWGKYPAKVRYA